MLFLLLSYLLCFKVEYEVKNIFCPTYFLVKCTIRALQLTCSPFCLPLEGKEEWNTWGLSGKELRSYIEQLYQISSQLYFWHFQMSNFSEHIIRIIEFRHLPHIHHSVILLVGTQNVVWLEIRCWSTGLTYYSPRCGHNYNWVHRIPQGI